MEYFTKRGIFKKKKAIREGLYNGLAARQMLAFGTFFATNPGDINESNFVFLLKEAMYLLTGSKRTSFSQNINEFTMMPSYSSADLRFTIKNLYMKWDDQYLCGKTPFDYVYAPPVNERHVFVSAGGSQ